jgi:signal transduction histidine kinase
MREFATSVLEAKDIEIDFKVEEEVNHLTLDMEARRDFFLIFKEAINNAAKYSQCKHVSINIGVWNKRLLLDIFDDGIGFDANIADNGNGLINMRKRADSLKGKIAINSNPGMGTKVSLNVPL